MVASVLYEAGYRTGLYTSPHLKDFRERIKVNGRMISENEVVLFVAEHFTLIDSLRPSFFELTVAMAFDNFAKCNVDVAVIEVGLGGRLDSTNIITPVLSVITNIGHDHMDLLGDTFERLLQKGGIIKKDIPVIISETQTETKDVFISKATQSGSEIVSPIKGLFVKTTILDKMQSSKHYVVTDLLTEKKIAVDTILGGDYQAKNIQAVFTVCDKLNTTFNISELNVTEGIRKSNT